MFFSSTATAALLAFLTLGSVSNARPASSSRLQSRALNNTLSSITIHESCNETERGTLTRALQDTFAVAEAARDYIVKNGADEVYQRYFGKAQPFSVIGVFDHLLSGDKTGVLLRCDDIDQNCHQDGWAGHWRGLNATSETVICPLSYQIRKFNDQWCQDGYTVTGSSASYYFATDLIHRFFHVPKINNNIVGHYADEYADCLGLAVRRPQQAGYNTHTLQYFASEAYALTVARPGVGCTGTIPEIAEEPESSATATASGSCRE
ncbi:Prenylated Rab acceptor protein 1 [Marasmius tenuissimus]|uniref:Prenylated Rab acceptor protein 1 n=1 Tax=Marasmius tenuissimus TaxID=585030 RepID=A0ABR2ZXN4_9AGAR